MNEIRALIKDYNTLIERIEIFYQAFRKQWFAENKPFGFEVQDMRLGGLIQRTKSCAERLRKSRSWMRISLTLSAETAV